MRPHSLFSAAGAALLLFVGCASQGPPSGGPPDRTPPYVELTVPANDAVSVGTDTRIEIRFSEEMDHDSVERSVFLSPRPEGEVDFGWRGRRLRIRTDGPLAANRTYRVTVGAEGRDASRNKLTSSYEFVFSTGASIHQGEVFGRVQGLSTQPCYVVLFDLDEGRDPRPGEVAPYVTQPGEDGRFTIRGLAPGMFRVFAFEDGDQDGVYDFGHERLAIATEDADIRDVPRFVFRDLKLADRDTIPPRVMSARSINRERIRVTANEAVALRMQFEVRDGEGRGLAVDGIYHDPADSSVVHLVTARQGEGLEYAVTVSGLEDAFGNVSTRDTVLVVRGDGRGDGRGPEIVRVDPAGGTVRPDRAVVLTFDEAMSPVRGDVWAPSDSTLAPEGRWTLSSPNRAVFEADRWEPGTVSLRSMPGTLTDRSGNELDDPVGVSFEVIADRDLGTLIGYVAPQTLPVRIRVTRLGEAESMRIEVAAGDTVFTADGLVPGAHVVSGFVDENNDGAWFSGTTVPYAPAEPVMSRIDTIDVRARWETVIEAPLTDHPTQDQIE